MYICTYVYMCIKFITVSQRGRGYYHRYLQISKEQYAQTQRGLVTWPWLPWLHRSLSGATVPSTELHCPQVLLSSWPWMLDLHLQVEFCILQSCCLASRKLVFMNWGEGIVVQIWRDPGGSKGKESFCNAGDSGDTVSIPGLGISSREGNGNPLQYSCLENPVDGGAWRVAKSWTQLSDWTRMQ